MLDRLAGPIVNAGFDLTSVETVVSVIRRLQSQCNSVSFGLVDAAEVREKSFIIRVQSEKTERFVVKLRLRDNENVSDAVKRFRKLVEHAGIKREMRKREFYEKPSDERRRTRRRAEMRARNASRQSVIGG